MEIINLFSLFSRHTAKKSGVLAIRGLEPFAIALADV